LFSPPEGANLTTRSSRNHRPEKTRGFSHHHVCRGAPRHSEPGLFSPGPGVHVDILPVDRHAGSIRTISAKPWVLAPPHLHHASEQRDRDPPACGEISRIAGNITFRAHGRGSGRGKIPVDVRELGVDFLTVAGHKLYGPKAWSPVHEEGKRPYTLIHGGGQERGRGPEQRTRFSPWGLELLAALPGQLKEDEAHMTILRDRLQRLLFEGIDGLVLNGHPAIGSPTR